jgi:hypothetical protein
MWLWQQQDSTPSPVPTTPEATGPQELLASVTEAEQLGLKDGQRGDPPRGAIDKILATADQAWLLSVTRLQQNIASAQAILQMEEKLHDDAHTTLNGAQAALQTEAQKHNASPAEYSRGIGRFLVFAAALLFLSDIPLSLSLVSKGLQLPAEAQRIEQTAAGSKATEIYVRHDEHQTQTQAQQEDWSDAVANGRTISATDLLRHPLIAIPLFWDNYALALGIALLGFSLKPILDLILDDRQEVQRARAKRLLWIVGILFCVTTVSLGAFRGGMNKQEAINRLSNRQKALGTAKLRAQLGGADAAALKTIDQQIEEINEQIVQERSNNSATFTFILLTTALPLIGAACFYFGARRLDNANNVTRLQRARDAAAQALRAAAERVANARARLEQLSRFLSELTTTGFRDTHRLLLRSSYERSFFHGLADSEEELTRLPLFGRLQHAFHDSISRRERLNRFAQRHQL